MMTLENAIVPLSKSCSESLIQQVYVMNYMQDSLNQLQLAELDEQDGDHK